MNSHSFELLYPTYNERFGLPLMTIAVSCGVADAIEPQCERIDLDEFVRGQGVTYYLRVRGDSMIELGIHQGDLIVVDRERNPETNDVVVAEIRNGYTIKLFKRRQKGLYLVPANGKYPTHEVNSEDDFAVWGVVTHVLHKF